MAFHVYAFLLVVFLILFLALLWLFPGSIFSLPMQGEGPSAPRSNDS
jgi:hypothetical protein